MYGQPFLFNGMLIQNNTDKPLDLVVPIHEGKNWIVPVLGDGFDKGPMIEVDVALIEWDDEVRYMTITCADGTKYTRAECYSEISPHGWRIVK